MTKSELIARLAEVNPHLYQRDVERIVTTVFEEITAALVNGDRVELRGFGAFRLRNAPPGWDATQEPGKRCGWIPN